MTVSIIIPVYEEAGIVDGLLDHLSGLDAAEIIIVDGGSRDGTWKRLTEARMPRARLLRTDTGRARQLNTGALEARGDVLLFLHADTRLPPGALARIEEALERHPGREWGRFDVRFDAAGPLLKLVAGLMNRRSALTGICTGDQAVFVYRDVFLDVGGFAPVPLMEDIELSARLRRRTHPLRLREPVTTSSRRWREDGAVRTIVSMWRLRWLYWRGVPASVLAARYYPGRRWKRS